MRNTFKHDPIVLAFHTKSCSFLNNINTGIFNFSRSWINHDLTAKYFLLANNYKRSTTHKYLPGLDSILFVPFNRYFLKVYWMQALFRFSDAVDLNMTEPELKFHFLFRRLHLKSCR